MELGIQDISSDFVFKALLSSRLIQLENQISHYKNTALHHVRHRNMDKSGREPTEGKEI